MFSSAAPELSAQDGAGATPWGPGAEAESCTHPAKRDRSFPPPIAERKRLPNVGIDKHLGIYFHYMTTQWNLLYLQTAMIKTTGL